MSKQYCVLVVKIKIAYNTDTHTVYAPITEFDNEYEEILNKRISYDLVISLKSKGLLMSKNEVSIFAIDYAEKCYNQKILLVEKDLLVTQESDYKNLSGENPKPDIKVGDKIVFKHNVTAPFIVTAVDGLELQLVWIDSNGNTKYPELSPITVNVSTDIAPMSRYMDAIVREERSVLAYDLFSNGADENVTMELTELLDIFGAPQKYCKLNKYLWWDLGDSSLTYYLESCCINYDYEEQCL